MKKLFISLICLLIFAPIANAEKLAIKIAPTQIISTHNNEVEVGDWIKFKTTEDIYYKDRLFIKKDTPVIGVVDSLHENGLVADNAEISFKTFYVRNMENILVKINYSLTISRKNSICKGLGDKTAKYVGVIFRGNEIKVEPESVVYNLFLVK